MTIPADTYAEALEAGIDSIENMHLYENDEWDINPYLIEQIPISAGMENI